jgi:hypothetical protein
MIDPFRFEGLTGPEHPGSSRPGFLIFVAIIAVVIGMVLWL